MKFTFDVPELQKRLSQLASVIKQKSPEPIYGFVRLFADADGVKLQGIDIDTTLTVKLPGASTDTPNSGILLPYGLFSRVVSVFKTKQAFVTFENEQTAVISNGAKFRGKLEGAPTEKFAALPVVLAISDKPELGGYAIGLPGLKEQVEQVEFAVKPADGKFVVSNALLESTADCVRLVATDGVRLAISTIPANLGEFTFSIPKPALELVKKLDGGTSVTIVDTDGVFYFTTELETLTYSKTHGDFPAYYRVIPKAALPTKVVIASKDAFLEAFNAAKLFCSTAVVDGRLGIRFTANAGENVIRAIAVKEEKQATGDNYFEMANDEIPAVIEGKSAELRLDVQYVEQFIAKAIFPLTIYINNAQSVTDFHANGSTFEKPTYRYLLMPMRGGEGATVSTPVEPAKK